MKPISILVIIGVFALAAEDGKKKPYLSVDDALAYTETAAHHFQQQAELNKLAAQYNVQLQAAQAAQKAYQKIVEDLRGKAKLPPVCRIEATGETLSAKKYAWECAPLPASGVPLPAPVPDK